jgi:RecA-family ATPase
MPDMFTANDIYEVAPLLRNFPQTLHGVRKRFKKVSVKKKGRRYYPFAKLPKDIQTAILKKNEFNKNAPVTESVDIQLEDNGLDAIINQKEDEEMSQQNPDIINGLLSAGAYILAGKPKDGKSTLAVSWGLALSCGASVFNVPCDQGKVLYLSYEDPQYRFKERVLCMLKSGLQATPDFIPYFFNFPTMSEGGDRILEKKIEQHKPKLVIIDTLKRFKDGYTDDENFMEIFRAMGVKHQVCILFIHHRTKGTARDVWDTISMSSGLTRPADGLMMLERKSEDSPFAELLIKSKEMSIGRKKITLIEDKAHHMWQLDAPKSKETIDSGEGLKRDKIIKALRSSTPANPMTVKQIEQASGCKNHYVKKVLGQLLKSEDVYKPKRGAYVLMHRALNEQEVL